MLKYDHQEGKLLHQPYHIPANAVAGNGFVAR